MAKKEAKDFVQMDLLAWGGIHEEQQAPEQTPFDEPSEESTDGITADRFDHIDVCLPTRIKAKVSITLAQGDSGKWYYGRHIQYAKEGNGYAAWPKFSEAYPSRCEAILACKADILLWLKKRGMPAANLRLVEDELNQVARCMDPEEYHRTTTCHEWRECGYAERCFAPGNDKSEDPVCFKEQETDKGKQAAKETLSDLCAACKADHPGCDKCCSGCTTPCSDLMYCRWPGAHPDDKQPQIDDADPESDDETAPRMSSFPP